MLKAVIVIAIPTLIDSAFAAVAMIVTKH